MHAGCISDEERRGDIEIHDVIANRQNNNEESLHKTETCYTNYVHFVCNDDKRHIGDTNVTSIEIDFV